MPLIGRLIPRDHIMTTFAENLDDLRQKIRHVGEQTHAGMALVAAAVLEDELLLALLTKMRPLNKALYDRLFEGYGPLRSFAAKIDLSYALKIVNRQQYDDLNTVRKIRNQFAHSKDQLNFNSAEIQAHFQSFKPVERVTDFQRFYLKKIMEIDAHIDELLKGTYASAKSTAPG